MEELDTDLMVIAGLLSSKDCFLDDDDDDDVSDGSKDTRGTFLTDDRLVCSSSVT